MAHEASSSSEDEYIPFSQRPEFADVVPIAQSDSPMPVCPIRYDDDFRETMDYFRAFVNAGERSERALALTREVVELSAANYTAWQYRRDIIVDLTQGHEDSTGRLHEELAFITDAIRAHPKNYQVWFHRRWLVEKLNESAEDELAFTAEILAVDAKNYHAWSHRQWTLQFFNAWENEVEFVEAELHKDVRNNSAWNQRYFVIASTKGGGVAGGVAHVQLPCDVAMSELQFATTGITRAPNNEASWNYLTGLMRTAEDSAKEEVKSAIKAFCEAHKDAWPLCAPLLATLVRLGGDGAKEAALKLEKGVDDVHAKYWASVAESLKDA